jgi:hypothetical protein
MVSVAHQSLVSFDESSLIGTKGHEQHAFKSSLNLGSQYRLRDPLLLASKLIEMQQKSLICAFLRILSVMAKILVKIPYQITTFRNFCMLWDRRASKPIPSLNLGSQWRSLGLFRFNSWLIEKTRKIINLCTPGILHNITYTQKTTTDYVLSALTLGHERAKFKAKETAKVLTKSATSNFKYNNINLDYAFLRCDEV